jgi:hypothetical protein
MKTRCVFSTPDMEHARAAMRAALDAGIDDDDICFVARDDIELENIPDHRMTGRTDFVPSAFRGVACGGGAGLLLGLLAAAVPPLGVTLAGAGVAAVAGAAVGGWTGALIGSEVPDVIHRKFGGEIASGHILVILDADRDRLEIAGPAVARTGATPLPFRAHTALT